MGYTSEFRAGRMIWRFRGSGGRDAKHTWPFQDAPRELKQSVLRLIVLRDNELPLLLSATENEIALLTTDRVARVSGADVEWADLADVVRVMHDIRAQWTAELMEKFSEPLGMQGTTAPITLHRKSGRSLQLNLERGGEYYGWLNVLRVVTAPKEGCSNAAFEPMSG